MHAPNLSTAEIKESEKLRDTPEMLSNDVRQHGWDPLFRMQRCCLQLEVPCLQWSFFTYN